MLSRPFRNALLATLPALALAAPAQADPIPYERIVRNFDVLAFRGEYSGRQYEVLRKWKDPLRLAIMSKTYPESLESDVQELVALLSRTTGHPVELYYSERMRAAKRLPADFDQKLVNVYLYYEAPDDLPKILSPFFNNDPSQVVPYLSQATCFAKLFTKGAEIRRAMIAFPSSRPREHMRACVVEEISQILGLANDDATMSESIFNDTNPINELTAHDRLQLRVLYDRRLLVGMPRQEVLRTIPTILDDLNRLAAGQP
ncbi:MAG: DUF2927 domain-containing protein [Alphaproteobacteria bacterium]